MTSTPDEIEQAILDEINNNKELFVLLGEIPDEVAKTVAAFVPVDTGTAKASIEVQARRSVLKRLTTRKAKLGSVFSEDDPQKINAIEFGRHEGEHGNTPEFAPFRRAAHLWNEERI